MNEGVRPEPGRGKRAAQPQAATVLPGGDGTFGDLRPALRGELRLSLRNHKGRLAAIIEDPVRGRFFQTGPLEHAFISLLDGKRTVAEAVREAGRQRGNDALDEQKAREICNWLAQMNLLAQCGQAGGSKRLVEMARGRDRQQMLGRFNPVCFRLELINPDRLLGRVTPWLSWMFSWPMALVWIVAGAAAAVVIGENGEQFYQASAGILAPDRWLWLLVAWVVLKLVHEAAHGIACKRYGGEVPRAGAMFLLLAPLAFVDVTSSWRMASRWQRMVIAAAGMYVELLIAFIAVFIWAASPHSWTGDLAWNVVVMAGLSTVLFNANPLIRFDGYYLLADALGIVNLYGKGQAWFGDRLRHLLLGFPLDPNVCPASERWAVAIYGSLAFVWRIFLCASLLLAAGTMLGGFGIFFALTGAIFWIGLPIWVSIRRVRMLATRHPVRRKRVVAAALCTTGIVAACFVLRAPSGTGVPAIVQFRDERMIRASADAFVTEVRTADGQRVAAGDLLVRLSNPDLAQELVRLKQSLAASEVQSRIHGQRREIALQQSSQTHSQSLRRQIAEKQAQLDQLEVRAPIDGVVFARDIAHFPGRFLKQGDVVLSVADPAEKEVVLSIEQRQADAVHSGSEDTARVLFIGLPVQALKITSIEPRASDVPADPSLTALAGGPLAVRSSSDGGDAGGEARYRLLTPRFRARCDLPGELADDLQAGQRGTAVVRGQNLTLAGYWFVKMRDWVRSKLEWAGAPQIVHH